MRAVNPKRIRYFPFNRWPSPIDQLEGARFEGSNDLVNFIEIGRADETVHVGWNSFMIEIEESYRYFRMYHSSRSACRLA